MDKFQEQLAIPKWNGTQIRIGLTGGIGSGKSSVGDFLKNVMHYPVLDADIYCHEILASKSLCTDMIIQRYGEKITRKEIDQQNLIDRKKLGNVIFEDKSERMWLESILHPAIKDRMVKEINDQRDSPIIILIIPLLYEVKFTDLCTQVWVVKCHEKQQEKRIMKRDKINKEQAIERIKTQLPIEEKTKIADAIIDNTKGLYSWEKQVRELIFNLDPHQ